MPEPGGDYAETPILRADATDDDLQVQPEDVQSPEPGPVASPDATVEGATRTVCAICGWDAGTCGHQPGLTMEVPALCPA